VTRSRALAAACALVALAGCQRGPAKGVAAGEAAAATALLEQGRFDEAIARAGSGTDPDSLYVLGCAWAGKARTAPLPTPEPGAVVPAEGLFKPEELTALGFLEKAAAARPDHAATQLAIAELLAPHALARAKAEREGRRSPAVPPATGPDASPERVLRHYADAMQADLAATTAGEALIRFAVAAGRLAEADAAFQELLRRRHEDPDLLVRYGDFLAGPRGTPDAALAQYAQALIWRATDAATRAKMVDIHLRSAAAYLNTQQYTGAEARLAEARRVGIEPGSPQAQQLRQIEERLAEVRGR
jgi:hypothetical protein